MAQSVYSIVLYLCVDFQGNYCYVIPMKILSQKQEKPCNWNTKAGSFQTSKTCKIKFTLTAFHKHRNISWKAFVDETDTLSSRYDMIIGRDLLEELGINFLFKEHLMEWDNATTPMLDS